MEKAVDRLLIITAVFALLFGAAAYHFRGSSHATIKTFDREVAVCEYIDVDVPKLDVIVIPYDGKRIRVAYKNDLPLEITLGDNRLSITESSEFVISLFVGGSSDFGLYLYLPKTIYRDITIYTGAGNVRVGGVNSEKLTVITNSGDIFCEDAISLANLVTGSGNITLDCNVVIEESSIQSRSGNVSFIFPSDSSVAVDFETNSGECETDLISGKLYGSNMYSFNGGGTLIHATLETGTLTIGKKEKE